VVGSAGRDTHFHFGSPLLSRTEMEFVLLDVAAVAAVPPLAQSNI
jgi:hypothetical protein